MAAKSHRHYCAAVLVGLLLAGTATSTPAQDGYWDPLFISTVPPSVPGEPTARAGAAMAIDTRRQRLILYGGYSLDERVWSRGLAPGSAWSSAGSGGTGVGLWGTSVGYDSTTDRLVVFGGARTFAGGVAVASNGTFAFVNGSWLAINADPRPAPREFAASVFDPVDRRLIVFGGNSGPDYLGDLWVFNASTNQWSSIPQVGPRPSGRTLAMAAYDAQHRRMIVHGGWNGPHLSDTWALDLATLTWSQIITGGDPPPRRGAVMAYEPNGNRLILSSGYNGSYLQDLWQLSLGGSPAWNPISASGTSPPRLAAASTYHGASGSIFVFGGYSPSLLSDFRQLFLLPLPAWSSVLTGVDLNFPAGEGISMALRPSPRELYAWFGSATATPLWKLDLENPIAWEALLPAYAQPGVRTGHRAVWDVVRDRMVLFGGSFGSSTSNEVWVMEPEPLPTWRKLEPLGVPPEPREFCGLAFDSVRDRLLVVGGSKLLQLGEHLNDAWVLPFDGPDARTWLQLHPAGVPPTPRAIWNLEIDEARDRAIFFGGIRGPQLSDETWSLALGEAPAWLRLTTSGLDPFQRSHHVAALDRRRQRLVVFGGETPQGYRGDVIALQLVEPYVWTRLDPDGSPPGARRGAASTFDLEGDQVIIVGGRDSDLSPTNGTTRLRFGAPVAAMASLAALTSTPEGVHLEWDVADAAGYRLRVERAEARTAWISQGEPRHLSPRRVAFDDRSVRPGQRYRYRLALDRGDQTTWTAEAETEVPSALLLGLKGAIPNPGEGDRLLVEFELPRKAPGWLDLFDVTGRRIASRDVSGLEPGRHRVDLAGGSLLQPGLYLVRLDAAGEVLTSRAIVTR